MKRKVLFLLPVLLLAAACTRTTNNQQYKTVMTISETTMDKAVSELIEKHGEEHRERIERGVQQVADMWRDEDGTEDTFRKFCETQFLSDAEQLDVTLERFEHNLMLIGGYMRELRRDLSIPLQLDTGPIAQIDYLFGEFAPAAHISNDLFKSKLAFVALLNFPLSTLQERLEHGAEWTRRQWAETRLAQRFGTRVPSEINQELSTAYTTADNYINSYNIHMHHVIGRDGNRLFPEGLKLITHWGLRDELKAQYDKEDGHTRQQMIYTIMERIIKQEIPAEVIDNPAVDWHIAKNIVVPAGESPEGKEPAEREADTRYEMWLKIFNAQRNADAYHPDNPTHIDRRFNEDREILEGEVEKLFVSILSSPLMKDISDLIRDRLGRDLEPFDIWYTGFRSKPSITEEELDRIVAKKYPTVADFELAIPGILGKLGFPRDKAEFLASKISVDAARGAGHAMGAGRLVDNARLRTRVPSSGMNYKGYNIAIHELGHNVEQVMSFQMMDHTLLRGVPNTAFTEGFAFVFQSRDLELLGLDVSDPDAEALNTLDVIWSTYEIAGVALTDMRIWRWLYAHPDATPVQLREAALSIARDVWNEFFAIPFDLKDQSILCIYSHMIDGGMYTPDYPLGHIIAFQVEQFLKNRDLAAEMERMCTLGNLSPALWMQRAVGSQISTQPMLDAAKEAYQRLRARL